MSELVGARLGQYEIVEKIGSGGMATVYKARQPSLDRFVAVKVLHRGQDPHFAGRFKREARAIAQLQHPNILPIHDYGDEDGKLYLVMQYVDGGVTLDRSLARPAPADETLRIAGHVLAALHYAHDHGIVHRDIKPGNILLPAPRWPLLADFGIAKLLGENDGLTVPGMIIGTADYMAPEQATGQPIDARTDLYSVGVVLYQLLTGQVPFKADTPVAVLAKHTYEPPPLPRSINPDIPVPLEELLLRAMAKSPAERYQSAEEMAEDVERVSRQITQPRTSTQFNTLYQSGVRAMQEEKWELATELLTQFLALEPGHAEARAMLTVAESRSRPALQLAASPMRTARLSPETPAPIVPASPAGVVLAGQGAALDTPSRRSRLPAWLLGIGLIAIIAVAGGLLAGPRLLGGAAAPTAALQGEPVPTTGSASAEVATSAPSSGSAPTAQPPATTQVQGGSAGAPSGDPVITAPLPDPVGLLVYEDQFNPADQISGLEDLTQANDFSRGFHSPGVYHFQLFRPDETRFVMLPRAAYGDFSMLVDLWDNSDTFAGRVSQGVVFRARDDQHFYTLLIDPRRGEYSVRRRDGEGIWTDIIPATASPLIKQGAAVNQLRIDANGSSFVAYLNGAELARFEDDTYPFGLAGMLISNVDAVTPHMHFDNMKIWSADQPPTAVDLPATREDETGAMVLLPGGEFVMGGNERFDERAHIVTLEPFYIDRSEVTNRVYGLCVAAGACEPQRDPSSQTHPSYAERAEFAEYPAIHVTWEQANVFCGWAGKRLPTEAEWEMAASWNAADRTKTAWPWGNSFDAARLNAAESGVGDTTAAGVYPPELNGTVDMAGNVSEWTSTLYQLYPYSADDGREDPEAEGDRVLRGGSWAQSQGKARGFYRQPAAPTYADREIGFRCAASP
jgi:serine/threonine protein kinase/formylglycine-generating enzyme required for sulfatase activity